MASGRCYFYGPMGPVSGVQLRCILPAEHGWEHQFEANVPNTDETPRVRIIGDQPPLESIATPGAVGIGDAPPACCGAVYPHKPSITCRRIPSHHGWHSDGHLEWEKHPRELCGARLDHSSRPCDLLKGHRGEHWNGVVHWQTAPKAEYPVEGIVSGVHPGMVASGTPPEHGHVSGTLSVPLDPSKPGTWTPGAEPEPAGIVDAETHGKLEQMRYALTVLENGPVPGIVKKIIRDALNGTLEIPREESAHDKANEQCAATLKAAIEARGSTGVADAPGTEGQETAE